MKKDIPVVELARAGDYVVGSYKGHWFEGELWGRSADAVLLVGAMFVIDEVGACMGIEVESITRDIPDLPTEPGVVFFATVRGVENVQLMVTTAPGGEPYLSTQRVGGWWWHAPEVVDAESARVVYAPDRTDLRVVNPERAAG